MSEEICEDTCEQCGRAASEYIDGQSLCYSCAEEYADYRERERDRWAGR